MKAFRDLKELPREVWILCFATLVNRAGTMALPFLVLYLTGELHFSREHAGAMLMLYGIIAMLVAPISGRLTDTLGPMIVMRFSLVGSGLALLLYPLARTRFEVILVTIAFAVTAEMFRPAVLSSVSSSVGPELRKQAFALNRLAVNLGMSIGPLAGGFLAKVSFDSIFVVDGVTSLLSAVVLIFGLRAIRPASPSRVRADGAIAPILTRRALSDRAFLFFLLATIPSAVAFFQMDAALPLYVVRDLRLDEVTFGLMFTVNTVLIVLLEVPLNAATAHWPHRRTLALGSFLIGAGFGAVGLASGAWGLAASVVIWTFGEMMLLPSMAAYVSDISPEARRGEYMGLYSMSFAFSFSVGPWLGTLVMQRFGPGVLWAGCFAAGVASTLLMLRMRPNPSVQSASEILQ